MDALPQQRLERGLEAVERRSDAAEARQLELGRGLELVEPGILRRAVGRDELIGQVWKRNNVSDNQLAQTIAMARRLVDDDGVSQRLIRTVPGFGYHWVGAVEEVREAAAADRNGAVGATAPTVPDPAETASSHPLSKRSPPPASISSEAIAANRTSRAWIPIAVLGLLVAVATLVIDWKTGPAEPQVEATLDGLTWVLPAELADDGESWARIGLMALVSEGLRQQGASVVPIESVLSKLAASPQSGALPELAQALDADHVVAPVARRVGDQWIVELASHVRGGTAVRAEGRDDDLLAAGRYRRDVY